MTGHINGHIYTPVGFVTTWFRFSISADEPNKEAVWTFAMKLIPYYFTGLRLNIVTLIASSVVLLVPLLFAYCFNADHQPHIFCIDTPMTESMSRATCITSKRRTVISSAMQSSGAGWIISIHTAFDDCLCVFVTNTIVRWPSWCLFLLACCLAQSPFNVHTEVWNSSRNKIQMVRTRPFESILALSKLI